MSKDSLVLTGSGSFSRAVFNQYNFIALAGALTLSLAYNSRWPALVVGGAEVLWIFVAAAKRLLRLWGEAQSARRARAGVAAFDPEQALNDLEPAHAARLRSMMDMADEIRLLARERRLDRRLFGGGDDQVSALLGAFVNLATVHERLSHLAQRTIGAKLEQEIRRLEQTMAEEKDGVVRTSLKQAITLEQRRLRQLEQIDNQRRALGIKLDTLGAALDYLRSQIFGGSSSSELEAEINDALAAASFAPASESGSIVSLSRSPAVVTRTVTGLGEP